MYESEETETVSVDEILQLCNNELNSETSITKGVADLLESDKHDGGFEILYDDQIISNITDFEEEVDDNIEKSTLDLKSITSHSEAETILSKCTDWFQIYTIIKNFC